MSTLSTLLRSAVILQVFSIVLSQYPMPFPYPQPPMGAPMAPIPPLPPQNFLSPQIPMHFPMQKSMPSVVMPYYSRRKHAKKSKKRKKPRRYIGSDSSESREFDARRMKTRRQVLTPVVSYVTKDGYVVYQKKIKKEKAKDWLEMSKMQRESQELPDSMEEMESRRSVRHKKNY